MVHFSEIGPVNNKNEFKQNETNKQSYGELLYG